MTWRIRRVGALTSRATAVLTAQVTFAFGKEVVVVAMATAPAELTAGHRVLVVAPAAEVAPARTHFFGFFALICLN